MKIGILKVDSVLEKLQEQHGDYPEMISKVLRSNAAFFETPLSFVTYDVEKEVYPLSVDECDGYIIPGSRKSVYDDESWIRSLIEFVTKLDREKKKLVGICFGHQIIAQALGGKTEASVKGWGVGIHPVAIREKSWFPDPVPETYALPVSHKDQVTRLPTGAFLIASSKFCRCSMYGKERHIFSMQGHPEFTNQYASDLINMRRDVLGEQVYKKGLDSISLKSDRDLVASWILRFFLET